MATSVTRKTFVLCLAMLCLGMLVSPAIAVTIPVAPAADGEFAEGTQMFGPIPNGQPINISERFWYDYLWETTMWEYHFGIVQIPLSSLSGMNLNGASITLNFDILSGAAPMSIYGTRNSGDGAVTQDDYDVLVGQTAPRVQITSAGSFTTHLGWNSVDVASYVRDQITSGYPYASFYMTGANGYTSTMGAAEGSQGAYLEVTPAVPEPSSVLALGSGLVGLLGLVRRRK